MKIVVRWLATSSPYRLTKTAYKASVTTSRSSGSDRSATRDAAAHQTPKIRVANAVSQTRVGHPVRCTQSMPRKRRRRSASIAVGQRGMAGPWSMAGGQPIAEAQSRKSRQGLLAHTHPGYAAAPLSATDSERPQRCPPGTGTCSMDAHPSRARTPTAVTPCDAPRRRVCRRSQVDRPDSMSRKFWDSAARNKWRWRDRHPYNAPKANQGTRTWLAVPTTALRHYGRRRPILPASRPPCQAGRPTVPRQAHRVPFPGWYR